jgi:hypothetical protein
VFGSKSAKKVQKSKSFALSLSLSVGSKQALILRSSAKLMNVKAK